MPFKNIFTADFLSLTPFKAFALIALLCLVVYFPSLFHVARGDQVTYLAEAASRHDQSWVSTVLGNYNYNRTRHFSPGDEQLFRPGFYWMFGLERYLFGYDFKLWQAVGLLCHLIVVGWLLRLAWMIRPGYFSAACVAIFAVMTAHMEMVIWHHISAYMVFLTLVLMGVYYLERYRQERSSSSLWRSALAFAASLMFYEIAVMFMVFVLAYAYCFRISSKHLKQLGAFFACVLVVYFGWDLLDYVATGTQKVLMANVAHQPGPWVTLKNMFLALGWWFYSGILPFKAELRAVSRMMAMGIHKPWGMACGLLFLGVCGSFLVMAVRAYCQGKRSLFKHGGLLILLMAMVVSIALLIAVGRMNVQDPLQALSVATYYGYFFWVFMAVIGVILTDAVLLARPMPVIGRWMAGAAMVVLLAINAVGTFQKNVEYARGSADLIRVTRQVEDFIAAHRAESDLSFFVPTRWPNYEIDWLINIDHPGKRYSYLEVLFPQYFRQDHPKYTLQ